jgi:uncharacterized membrane protein
VIRLPWRKRIALLRRKLYLYPEAEPMPHSYLFWVAMGLVSLAVIIFCVYFIALLNARFNTFIPNGEDYGIMDQALWNTAHGRLLQQTICNIVYDTNCAPDPNGMIRFAIHFEPVLLPISLFYLIWNDPKILFVLQTVIVAMGAFPAFWLARLRLRNDLAAVALALLYLLYPAQQQALTFDFHAVTLSAAFLLFLFYFMYTRRTVWMFVFAVLAMATKEQMPLIVGLIGLWSGIFQMRRSGWILFGVGVVWFGLAMKVVIPLSSPTGHPLLESRYDHLGSPTEFAFFVLRHPHAFFEQYIREPKHWAYLNILLAPALCLPLMAPWVFFLALPSLAINMLSSNTAMYSGVFHYSAEIVPILIFSTIEALVFLCWLARLVVAGVRSLLTRVQASSDSGSDEGALGVREVARTWFPARMVATVLLLVTLSGVLLSVLRADDNFYGQLPFSDNFAWPTATRQTQLAQQFVNMIPPDASVSTQNKFVPHLSHREHIYFFPYAKNLADYILLNLYTDPYPFTQKELLSEVQDVALNGHYGLLAAQEGFLLFKRGLPSPGLAAASPAKPTIGDGSAPVVGANGPVYTPPKSDVDPTQVLLKFPESFCSQIYVDQAETTLPNQMKADFTTPTKEKLSLVGFQANAPEAFQTSRDTFSVTTYWQVSAPVKTPVRLLLLLTGADGQVLFSDTDFLQMTWCPSTVWQPGKIVRVSSTVYNLWGTKVPEGPARMSIALLPLVQSASTVMDVQARLPLNVVNAPGSAGSNQGTPQVSVDNDTRALQLLSLKMTD